MKRGSTRQNAVWILCKHGEQRSVDPTANLPCKQESKCSADAHTKVRMFNAYLYLHFVSSWQCLRKYSSPVATPALCICDVSDQRGPQPTRKLRDLNKPRSISNWCLSHRTASFRETGSLLMAVPTTCRGTSSGIELGKAGLGSWPRGLDSGCGSGQPSSSGTFFAGKMEATWVRQKNHLWLFSSTGRIFLVI